MKHGYMERFEKMGAILRDDHFVLASGSHSRNYFDAKVLFEFAKTTNKELATEIGGDILERFKGIEIDLVIGPATGGNILARWITDVLNLRPANVGFEKVPLVTKKVENGGETSFVFESSEPQFVSGSNILVVEDVVTTGGTAEKVAELAREHNGNVVGIGAICTHGIATARKMGVPRFQALVQMQMTTYKEGYCPLCNRDVPINVEHGHGQEFLDRLAS